MFPDSFICESSKPKFAHELRVRLFWVKMISGNHFPPNPGVWQRR